MPVRLSAWQLQLHAPVLLAEYIPLLMCLSFAVSPAAQSVDVPVVFSFEIQWATQPQAQAHGACPYSASHNRIKLPHVLFFYTSLSLRPIEMTDS